MLKLLIFSVFDSKAEAFLRPFFAETRGLAIRSFSDAANDVKHEMCAHAEDYQLFQIGVYDCVKGIVSPLEALVPLGSALTFKRVLEGPRMAQEG